LRAGTTARLFLLRIRTNLRSCSSPLSRTQQSDEANLSCRRLRRPNMRHAGTVSDVTLR
jgi:hypothetical protein